MPLVHKQSGNRSGPSVDIFIVAPGGKVYVPVVQLQRDVPGGVCHVPANGDAEGVRVCGDGLDVEVLTRVVLDAGEED